MMAEEFAQNHRKPDPIDLRIAHREASNRATHNLGILSDFLRVHHSVVRAQPDNIYDELYRIPHLTGPVFGRYLAAGAAYELQRDPAQSCLNLVLRPLPMTAGSARPEVRTVDTDNGTLYAVVFVVDNGTEFVREADGGFNTYDVITLAEALVDTGQLLLNMSVTTAPGELANRKQFISMFPRDGEEIRTAGTIPGITYNY